MSAELRQRLEGLIGKKGRPSYGADEVNLPMIRHWCEMVEDANPLYWDEEFARSSKYKRIISPPVMLHTWIFGRWWSPPYLRGAEEGEEEPVAAVFRTLEEMGYKSTVAVSNEAEYLEPYGVEAGRLVAVRYVSEVSEEKETRLGWGVFLTMVTECYTEHGGRLVGINRMVLLKYRPHGGQR